MTVKLALTDSEATEVEYALKFRIRELRQYCGECRKADKVKADNYCEMHKPMVETLDTVILRLVQTGFSLQS